MTEIVTGVLETVIVNGVKYLVKRVVDSVGNTISQFFKDDDNDGVPDTDEPYFTFPGSDISDVVVPDQPDQLDGYVIYGDTVLKDVSHYNDLHTAFTEQITSLGEDITTTAPERIFDTFSSALSNTLCIGVTVSILVCFGFTLVSRLFSSFRGR